MQHRRVEVVDVDLVPHREKAIVVGRAELDPRFDSTAGEDGRESVRVVVAAVGTLRNRGSTEFATDNHKRILEHSASFEVFDEGSDRLVNFSRVALVISAEGVMLVPLVRVSHLHKPHSLLAKPASQQA